MGVSSNWKTRLKIKINEKITENEIRYFLDLSNYKKNSISNSKRFYFGNRIKVKTGSLFRKKSGPRTI